MEISPVHSLQPNGLKEIESERESERERESKHHLQINSFICRKFNVLLLRTMLQCYQFWPSGYSTLHIEGSKVCGPKILLKSKWF